MKANRYPLVAAVAITLFTLSVSVNAGETLRSPRDAANQSTVVSAPTASDPDLLRPYTGTYVFSPKALASRENAATIGGAAIDPDLVRASRAALYTGKNPAGTLATATVAVAPVK